MRMQQLREQFETENKRLKLELAVTRQKLKETQEDLVIAKQQLLDVRIRYAIHKLSQNRHRLLTQPGADE